MVMVVVPVSELPALGAYYECHLVVPAPLALYCRLKTRCGAIPPHRVRFVRLVQT